VVLVEADSYPVIPLEFYKSARVYGKEGKEDTTERSCFQDGGESKGRSSSLLLFLPIIVSVHSSFSQSPSPLALYDTSQEVQSSCVWKTVFAVIFRSLRSVGRTFALELQISMKSSNLHGLRLSFVLSLCRA